MNRKDVILEQFLYGSDKNGWFVSFNSAVEGLTQEQAVWKSSEKDNSIFEIVNHLNFWNERYLNHFNGIENPQLEGDNNSTFVNVKSTGWSEAAAQYSRLLKDWYNAVQNCDEEKLDQRVNEDKIGSWMETLTSITLHNAYHIGQIVSIRKIQGSWDPGQGVN